MRIDPFNQLWAIEKGALDQIREGSDHGLAGKIRATSFTDGDRLAAGSYARLTQGIAIVPVLGVLAHHFSWAFSYEEIATDIRAALRHEGVRGICLMIDSPGGLVAGCDDLAKMIFDARGTKPIMAHVSGSGCSAAYWLASAADEIVASRNALVGSIGAMLSYQNYTGIAEAAGATFVDLVGVSSPDKGLTPESERGREKYQDMVNMQTELFISSVATNRGVTPEHVKQNFGQGFVLSGQEAVDVGLTDRLGSFEDAFAEFSERLNGAGPQFNGGGLAALATLEVDMTKTGDAPAASTKAVADLTLEELQAANPSLVSEIQAAVSPPATQKPEKDVVAVAILAERARIVGIEGLAVSGEAPLVVSLIEDGSSVEAAAMKILQSRNDKGAVALAARSEAIIGNEVAAVPILGSAAATPVNKTGKPRSTSDEDLRAAWDGDEASRDEFSSYESFAAFHRAEAGSRFRVLGGGRS